MESIKKRNYPTGVIKRPNYGIADCVLLLMEGMQKESSIFWIKPKTLNSEELLYRIKRMGFNINHDYLIRLVNRKDKNFPYKFNKLNGKLEKVK